MGTDESGSESETNDSRASDWRATLPVGRRGLLIGVSTIVSGGLAGCTGDSDDEVETSTTGAPRAGNGETPPATTTFGYGGTPTTTSTDPGDPTATVTSTDTPTPTQTETSASTPADTPTETQTPTPTPEPDDEYGRQNYGEYRYGGVDP